MATTKVSELAALTTPDGAEELLINDGGTSKKITIANAIIAGTGITKSGATISASPVALTTVQTAANQTAHLALTAQEGDVVVRSDENKTYMHNGGSAGNMNDYTLLATPTDSVTSVGGNTGVVTNAQIAASVEAASDSNTFTDADHSKLNAIEASADVTDATNVDAAGALMKSGGTMTGALGIGIAVESGYQLHVDGDVLIDGDHTGSGGSNLLVRADPTDTTQFQVRGDGNVFIPSGNLDVTGNIVVSGTVDGVDIQTLNTTAGAALPKAGGTMTGNLNIGSYTANSNADNLVIQEANDFTGITLAADNDQGSNIYFADPEDDNVGGITYNHSSNYMNFRINGAEKLRIDSSGNVGINTTSPSKTLSVHTTSGSAGTPNGLYMYNEVHGSDSQIYMYAENDSGSNQGANIKLDPDAETFSFTGTGGQTAITIDDSGDVAIAGATTMADNLVMSGGADIYTQDNGKLICGNGSDLEIYHSGSTSYISDTGTGDLKILSSNDLWIEGANGEAQARFAENGAVTLYYDNSAKIATTSTGVDVTGSVTADGLTVDGDVVIQKTTGDVSLTLVANENNGAREPSIFLKGYSTNSNPAIQFGDNNGYAGSIQYENQDNSMRFAVNGGEEMRLESDGDLHVDGDVIAYSTTISDERLKDNIEVVEGALDKVKELKGVTFTRKQDGIESAGVIAQDVEKVLPQAVKHKALPLQTGNDELFKTVQYDALHALLIEAVKELSEKVEKLENK